MRNVLFVVFVCVVVIDISVRIVEKVNEGAPTPPSTPALAPAPKIDPERQKLKELLAEFRKRHDEEFGPRPRSWPWQEVTARANEFAALVHRALPYAERGNGDAQFALHNVFRYCRDALREQDAAQLRRVPEVAARELHERCDRLAREYPDLDGETERWLLRSIDSKFPRALAFAASEEVAAMSRKPPGKQERERRLAKAREKLMYALTTNDPAVTSIAADLLPALYADDPRAEQAAWVWRLAACEQGLECGPNTPFVLDDCRRRNQCLDGESQQDYIRRVSGDPPALMARARALSIALRKGEIDDRVLDETVAASKVPVARTVEKRAPTRLLQ